MPHASIGEALDVLQKLDLAIESVPEVELAVGKIGRVESALHSLKNALPRVDAPLILALWLRQCAERFKVYRQATYLHVTLIVVGQRLISTGGQQHYRNSEYRSQHDGFLKARTRRMARTLPQIIAQYSKLGSSRSAASRKLTAALSQHGRICPRGCVMLRFSFSDI